MGNKTKLDKLAFANSLSILMIMFYIVLYLTNLVAPSMFEFLFNTQFLGANIAPLLPKFSLVNSLWTLAVLVATCWIFGYAWAALYNRLAK